MRGGHGRTAVGGSQIRSLTVCLLPPPSHWLVYDYTDHWLCQALTRYRASGRAHVCATRQSVMPPTASIGYGHCLATQKGTSMQRTSTFLSL